MDVHALKVLEVLAEHDAVRTSLCEDPATGERVVLRTLSLKAARSHEEVELFERESAVLEHIDHPRLPRILHREREEAGNDVRLHQVRSFVEGQTLFDEVRGGRHLTEEEALTTALGVAETLAHLHGRSPALVHRDIKPQNLIRTPTNAAHPESVTVIDLGAIKAGPATGRTIVGTYGYMPPEQFEGRSSPASDVFALGMTLIFLLTHKEPGDFDDGGARAWFRAEANVSKPTAALIDAMIAYDPADRPADGAEVARRIRALLTPEDEPASSSKRPAVAPPLMGKPATLPPPGEGSPSDTRGTFSLLAFFRPDGDADNEYRWNHVEAAVMVTLLVGVPLLFGVGSTVAGWLDDDIVVEPDEVPPADQAPAAQDPGPTNPALAPAPFLGMAPADAQLVICVYRLFPRLAQSERRYLSWVSSDGPTGKERHIYGLYAGYDDAVRGCQHDEGLADFAQRALALIADANRYYDEEDYRDDAFARGRALHPQLLATWREMHERQRQAEAQIGRALEGLEAASDDPWASVVRELMRRAWKLAYAPAGDAQGGEAWVASLKELEGAFAQAMTSLGGGEPSTTRVEERVRERLERYRQDLKRGWRQAERPSSRHPLAQQRAELQEQTLRLLEDLVRDDQNLVLFKKRMR